MILLFYTYLGYAILLFLLVKVKQLIHRKPEFYSNIPLSVTLIVTAYNEESFIRNKIENSFTLDYPKDKIQYIFVTDGSNDNTPNIVSAYPEIELLHNPEREGKIKAVERSIPYASGDIIIFTDANTVLNSDAIKNIVRHFGDEKVGVVSGEKRIFIRDRDEAAGTGEGLYWKYESKLKKMDDALYSVMGAAGELYAIRTQLFEPIPQDSLIEDFYLSLKIVQKGYKIAYEPNAYALEEPSASISEELKRKVRIAAGGIQSIIRLKELLNPFKYGVITFQYVSHRVLRWTLAPLALPVLFLVNIFLLEQGIFYQLIFACQLLFYAAAVMGLLMEKKQIRFKLLFIPYYFCIMNYAVYAGFIKYLKGSQSVIWEKSSRRTN